MLPNFRASQQSGVTGNDCVLLPEGATSSFHAISVSGSGVPQTLTHDASAAGATTA
jgi:hypothetical protein